MKLDHQCSGGDIIFVCSKVSSLCTFYIDFFIGGRLIFYNHIYSILALYQLNNFL